MGADSEDSYKLVSDCVETVRRSLFLFARKQLILFHPSTRRLLRKSPLEELFDLH